MQCDAVFFFSFFSGRKCFLLSSLFIWRRRTADTLPQDLWSTFLHFLGQNLIHSNVTNEPLSCTKFRRRNIFGCRARSFKFLSNNHKNNDEGEEIVEEINKNWNAWAKWVRRCELEKYAFPYICTVVPINGCGVWRFVFSHMKRHQAKKGLFLPELNHLNSLNSIFACVVYSACGGAIALKIWLPISRTSRNMLVGEYIYTQMWRIMCRSGEAWRGEAVTAISQIIHLITHSVWI